MKTLFRPTKIASKVVRQLAVIIGVSFVLTVCLAYAIFWPRLRDEEHNAAATASRYIMQLIDEEVSRLSGFGDYIANSPVLSDALRAYAAAPGEQNRAAVSRLLTELGNLSSNIRAAALTVNDAVFYSDGPLGPEDRKLLESSWFTDLASGQDLHTWSSFYVSSLDQPSSTIAQVVTFDLDGAPGALCLFYDAESLMSTIDTLAMNVYSGYMLTDSHDSIAGVPFFQQGSTGNAQDVAAAHLGPEPYSGRDRAGYYFIITIPANQWILVGFIDLASFNASFVSYLWLLLAICLLLGLLILLLLVPQVNRLLAPIGRLGQTMKAVSHEGGDFYSDIQSDDEIGELAEVFNDMLDELRINAERQIEQETESQQMSYNLMLAQINSHFFYNTLSVINSLARQGRTEDVVRANTALTAIFQDCLRPQSLRAGDTVEQEMAVVDCYWVIEKLDPANKCELIWDVPETLKSCAIPKNIIQPLVENALLHGLDDPNTGRKTGTVTVTLRQEENRLRLQVQDNGCAIQPEKLAWLNNPARMEDTGAHIGLRNIRKRLALIYGDTASLTITAGPGTCVTIRMPILDGKDGEI
jgi:sensor histidine kinase YesM